MVDINAAAQQALTQGNAMLNDYRNKATDFRGQYDTYRQQADTANKNVADYSNYMKGEGSAENQYNKAFTQRKTELGFDPEQMTMARANLNQAQGALSAYSDFANTAASKWGLNAGGFAAANAGALSGLNNNIASNQGVVNSLSDIYKTAQTGANEFTGTIIQGQHETLGALQAVYNNAANSRDEAASMMSFYDDLAAKQGGLNASQQQYYAQAKQAYANASAAMAQASLYGQQAAQIQQQIQQGNDYMNSSAYKSYLNGDNNAGKQTTNSNANNNANSGNNFNLGSVWNNISNNAGNIAKNAATNFASSVSPLAGVANSGYNLLKKVF